MKPLASLQLIFSWISMYPAAAETALWKRFVFKAFPMVLIIGNLSGLISSSVFFLKFITTDLEGCLYALFQIVGQLDMTNAVITTFASRNRIAAMFKSLEDIYDAGKCMKMFEYVEKLNFLGVNCSFFIIFKTPTKSHLNFWLEPMIKWQDFWKFLRNVYQL